MKERLLSKNLFYRKKNIEICNGFQTSRINNDLQGKKTYCPNLSSREDNTAVFFRKTKGNKTKGESKTHLNFVKCAKGLMNGASCWGLAAFGSEVKVWP